MSFFIAGWKLGVLLWAGAATDFAAGNFRPCVAGGLGGKIIGPAVNDHGAADDVLHAEAVCEKDGEGVAAAAEEGRQIPGMLGMGTVGRVVMAACIGKGIAFIAGAAGTGMDMKGKDRVTAGPRRLRQTGNMSRHNHAPVGLIKAHGPMNVRVLPAAPYPGDGRGPLSDAYDLIQVAHKVTSDHCMPGGGV